MNHGRSRDTPRRRSPAVGQVRRPDQRSLHARVASPVSAVRIINTAKGAPSARQAVRLRPDSAQGLRICRGSAQTVEGAAPLAAEGAGSLAAMGRTRTGENLGNLSVAERR